MSVRCMTWVWDHSDVGGTERLVLLAIADCANDTGTEAWPSVSTLARKCRVDERTVRRIVRRLETDGHLGVQVAAGPGGSNRYAVIMGGGLSTAPGDPPPGQPAPLAPRPLPPDTAMPGTPGHSYAPRTSLNVQNRQKTYTREPRWPSQPGGAANPPASRAAGRCPVHVGQYAASCTPCRSERLAGGVR